MWYDYTLHSMDKYKRESLKVKFQEILIEQDGKKREKRENMCWESNKYTVEIYLDMPSLKNLWLIKTLRKVTKKQ